MSGVLSAFNLCLIKAYKECPALYDSDHADYKVHLPTKECWQKISDTCATGPAECRVRWNALRDRYIKERKRIIVDDQEALDQRWPLYSKMNFLDPFVEKQRSATRVSLVQVNRIGAVNSQTKKDSPEPNGAQAAVVVDDHEIDEHTPTTTTIKANNEPSEEGLKTEDAFCLRLINAVEGHKLIYAHTDPSYRVSSVRTQTWDDIAEEINDPSFTGKDLRKKWRSIRDKYIRERRLIRESAELGQNKTSTWTLFHELSFLDPYLETNCSANVKEEDKNLHVYVGECSLPSTVVGNGEKANLASASFTSNNKERSLLDEKDATLKTEKETKPTETTSLRRKRKLRVEEDTSVQREILRYVKTNADSLHRLTQSFSEDNEEMIFARYVATFLQNMPADRRAQLKLQIFAVLHSIPDTSLLTI